MFLCEIVKFDEKYQYSQKIPKFDDKFFLQRT